jgi:hypothetical protein
MQIFGLASCLEEAEKGAQPIIDRMANQLPRWKADLLTKAGRKVCAVCAHIDAHLPCHGFGFFSMGSQSNG